MLPSDNQQDNFARLMAQPSQTFLQLIKKISRNNQKNIANSIWTIIFGPINSKMKSNNIQNTGEIIRQLREHRKLPLRKIAALLDIDTSYYSKIERSEKKATREQIHLLENFFEVEKNSLMIQFLSEKIYHEISEEDCAGQVLKAAEARVKYEKESRKN
jgi:transcriptional regulator with XRE-family HTH domain